MTCKSNIYVTTTTPSAVVANGTLPLSTIVRRRGNDVNLSGDAITVTDCGSNYYLVAVSATFTAPVAGVVTVTLQQNGAVVSGATASATVTTATTEVHTVNFTAIVRTFNNQSLDSLTLVNTGVAATYSNIAFTVTKL
jgi:non-ribosomal peptide synthetase component E (peptide arylation enzyme)